MAPIDWAIIAGYLVFVTAVGFFFLKRASGSVAEFFVAGRNLPWWIAGTSLIATSFAADTPLAITGIVAEHGIAGNWLWWNQVVVWILAVVFFARLWRRSGLLTDAELIELRYDGRPAAFLRGFKAFYYSVIMSTFTLAWVMLAMQKIVSATIAAPPLVLEWQQGLESAFGLAPGSIDLWKWLVLIVLFLIATLYTVVSGYWGIVVTDLLQFTVAMVGSVLFAVYAVDAVGGLGALKIQLAEHFGARDAQDLISFFPALDSPWMPLTTFAVYLGVLWWGDCGGFAAQRMFSTRSDRDAVLTALWYSVAHFALRPWPWIVVALVTLVYYPELADREAGYPMLMMEILPAGLRGMLVASLLAAFMSTVDTHLNWNASYFVNDVYRRFIVKDADERRCVLVSRLATVGFAALAIVVAYFMTSIKDAWIFLFNLQAGIGLVIMLRWLWWRVNVWSEISAMIASLITTPTVRALRDYYAWDWSDAFCIMVTAGVCTSVWLIVTWLTPPTDSRTLETFYRKVRPPVGAWGDVAARCGESSNQSSPWELLLLWLGGAVGLYAGMFAIGGFILGRYDAGLVSLAVFTVCRRGAVAVGWIKKVARVVIRKSEKTAP